MTSKNPEPALSYFEILELVKSEFQLRDSYLREDVPTFIIIPSLQDEDKTKRLRAKLSERGLDIVLRRRNGELVLMVVALEHRLRPSTIFSRIGLPIILFAATVVTVAISGYLSASDHIGLLKILGRWEYSPAQENAFRIELTLLYVVSVMGVLGLHELGHLIACHIHHVKASLPLFIPGIPGITPGTFGAVVRQESPASNRNELFDIGICGPLLGFIGALIVSYFGYSWSIPVTELEYMHVVQETGPSQIVLLPALFMILGRYIIPNPQSYTHFLHPIAWAGWITTLVTFWNVFPIGQLDGGHVSRALLGQRWHRNLSYIMIGIMILAGWWEMGLLVTLLIRTYHPGALDDVTGVTQRRKIAGVFVILIFIACFTLSADSPLLMLIFR